MAAVRPALDTDRDDCVAALYEVHRSDGYPVHWPEDPGGWLAPPELIATWVAEHDGRIVGHVALIREDSIPAELRNAAPGRDFAFVARLFVVPRARRLGLAGDLLTAAAAGATAAGLVPGLIVVADSALYERAGWRRLTSGPGGWTTAAGTPAWVHFYLAPDSYLRTMETTS
jgi:GNAT superfamily N-acetyltransferase